MKVLAALLFLLLLVSASCTRQAVFDRDKLDALLSSYPIDRIDFVEPVFSLGLGTNSERKKSAEELVFLINKTNRVPVTGAVPTNVQCEVYLMSGTNGICHLTLLEGAVWRFGDYCFYPGHPR